jgi:hypothetical protein
VDAADPAPTEAPDARPATRSQAIMTAESTVRRPFARLARGLAAATLVTLTFDTASAALPPGNTVQQWNKIAEDTVVGSGALQNEGLIYMAYVSAAVYNAVAAIDGSYEPYRFDVVAPPHASLDAAVVEAASGTLQFYFPGQAMALEAWRQEALALIAEGDAKDDGRAVGMAAAEAMIRLRAGDGRLTAIATTSAFATHEPGPGVWRLTPSAFAAPQTPWVGSVTPFVLTRPDQFHPAPPPPLTSERWAQQYDEVKEYGAATGSVRTADQTAIARFWTANVVRQYNLVGRDLATTRSLDLVRTARLLAMINVVGADAQISVMHWKYEFLAWRPVTAIDPTAVTADGFGPVPGFEDGNHRTVEQLGWRPLLATPNHPEFPSAHGSITSAVAEVLTEFLGSDHIDVTIRGFDPAGAAGNLNAARHFDSAASLRAEIADARVLAGLHFRGSCEAGIDLGRAVAHYTLNHAFRNRQ